VQALQENDQEAGGGGEDMTGCRVCGALIPRLAHVCLKCGVWTRTGPAGLYVAGVLKAVGALATGVALPLVLLFASKRLDDRSAESARIDSAQKEQAAAINKTAADAHDATLLSVEVFEIESRLQSACEEYASQSAIAHEPWLGPSCATAFLNALSELDVAIGKVAYRIDELPVSSATVRDMRRLSEKYWGATAKPGHLRQDLLMALHVPVSAPSGIGLKYCGPLISQTPDRRSKCDAQLAAVGNMVDEVRGATNLVFCGLSHDLAEFRIKAYGPAGGTVPAADSVFSMFAQRLRENADSNLCSQILKGARTDVSASAR
jgi:hypothetical protein